MDPVTADPAPAASQPAASASPASSAEELVATLPGIVWEADGTDYRMAYVSPRARDLLGHDPAEWTTAPDFWEAHLHPDDRDEAMDAVAHAVATLESTTLEYRFRGADGLYRLFHDVIRVIERPDGHRHIVGFMVDRTDEAGVEGERRLLATILQSAADAAYANALDGTVLAWNAAAERIYGWRSEEVLGRRIYDLVEPDNHERIASWLSAVGRGETLGPLDMEQVGRDGKRLTLSVTAAPVRDDAGRVAAVATIARDVSEERRAATERADLEAELFQAQKLEAVGRLAGGIAHDFNNMLTAILGYAGLVAIHLEGDDLEAQREVIRAAERAADLTRRLLTFSRPAASEPRPVEIDEALGDAMGMLRRLVPERVVLHYEPGSRAHVLATPVEIEQVLMNLVINAADATSGRGAIVVSTSMAHSPAPGAQPSARGFVRIRVADHGAGMDAETRLRIFDPFFSTKGFGDGTGLGLFTVHGIVSRAGGSIGVSSRPGRGSTFDVFLPVSGPPEAVADDGAGAAVAGSGRVLVVDDSEVVGRLASRILRTAGYLVDTESDPSAVVARGAAGYDAIVSDVVMPGMSGPDMVDALGLAVPVVFLSGYAAEVDPAELGGRPDRVFVAKPFSGPDLLAAVRAVMLAARG